MRYQNSELREKLAGEFVLGTLHGPARNRFKNFMKYDVNLRGLVSEWENSLIPLTVAIPKIEPLGRVWQAIYTRINKRSTQPSFFARLGFWRNFAVVSSTLALGLALYLSLAPTPEPAAAMVAVLHDTQAKPVMLVSWRHQTTTKKHVRVKVMAAPIEASVDKSLELWMLPKDKTSPISMGVVSMGSTQALELSETASKALNQAAALAISLEPKGGSPTGQPTGPVLYQGACIKV